MKLESVRSALAESCRKHWTARLESHSVSEADALTPVEEQAIVFSAIDDRYGITVTEEEIERLLKAAEQAKRAWTQIQSAILNLAGLRLDQGSAQLVAVPKNRLLETADRTARPS